MFEMNKTSVNTMEKGGGLRKAAVLLIAMGEEGATQILKNLSKKEVEKITKEISTLRNISPALIKEVVSEYYNMWRTKEFVSQGGYEYAELLLNKALDPEQARSISQNLGFLQREKADSFERLEDVDNEQLISFLSKEHFQTIAFILSRMDSKKAAAILEKLPADQQIEVAHRIATLGEVSEDFIYGVEDFLESHFKEQFRRASEAGKGQKIIANILNMTGKSTEKNLLNGISEINPEIASEIKNLMFVFDDLVYVDDRSIQKILKEIDVKVLSMALKGTNEETKEKIFGNMSHRAANMLKEEMEYLGPVRIKEVEEAQKNILAIVSILEERGEIVVFREGSENEIVL